MRAVVQRVSEASVSIQQETVARIGAGLMILLGVGRDDGEADVFWLADKIFGLRIFSDASGKMSRALAEVGGEILVVSQFTLYGKVLRGLRPDFTQAMGGDEAYGLYRLFVDRLREKGAGVRTGQFGALMAVSLVNDGPVTIILDTDEVRQLRG